MNNYFFLINFMYTFIFINIKKLSNNKYIIYFGNRLNKMTIRSVNVDLYFYNNNYLHTNEHENENENTNETVMFKFNYSVNQNLYLKYLQTLNINIISYNTNNSLLFIETFDNYDYYDFIKCLFMLKCKYKVFDDKNEKFINKKINLGMIQRPIDEKYVYLSFLTNQLITHYNPKHESMVDNANYYNQIIRTDKITILINLFIIILIVIIMKFN